MNKIKYLKNMDTIHRSLLSYKIVDSVQGEEGFNSFIKSVNTTYSPSVSDLKLTMRKDVTLYIISEQYIEKIAKLDVELNVVVSALVKNKLNDAIKFLVSKGYIEDKTIV
ncbi:Hypothetical protein ORPV_772 [Orpheovirus IHUMI-LCC2]|uniref:Uncharacterized protein n=1 Tax=Orpheovirus IHUMI-LCC2 TaxID=2023057 RepID=A0A2I2L580_9VIRU|nr:Hypothetical protein ORPV_772 [Orpheovirus IHUMI-LCC2]SNW62676.1 Hypothetical protein ORPV_772 [Orpheovirus IHUMI-LCC2]